MILQVLTIADKIFGIAPKVLTYAPGVGLIGLGIYQAVNQRDPVSAGKTFAEAAAIFGFGAVVHGTQKTVKSL